MYTPFDHVLHDSRIHGVYDLADLSFRDLHGYDFAIVAIYNDYGEDGKVLGILDTVGLPYLSPSLKVSAVCFDKYYTKSILRAAGVLTPRALNVALRDIQVESLAPKVAPIGYPVVVKATSSGNSYGMSVVEQPSDLLQAVRKAEVYSDEVLFEQYISGLEFTVGVYGPTQTPTALPVVQIVKNDRQYFDYVSKYTAGMVHEVCPAQISREITGALQKAACAAYAAVKCDSHARIDMIYGMDGQIYILDINTFPGLNSASLFPQELQAVGMTLGEFIWAEINRKCKQKSESAGEVE